MGSENFDVLFRLSGGSQSRVDDGAGRAIGERDDHLNVVVGEYVFVVRCDAVGVYAGGSGAADVLQEIDEVADLAKDAPTAFDGIVDPD